MNIDASKTLPSREIGYNYCVAMFMAQQFEDGLRYILFSGEHYGIIDELEMTSNEKKRHVDSIELIDNATIGRLLLALKKRIKLAPEHWQTLESAIVDRNFLAHGFLVQFDYKGMTLERETRIAHDIHLIFLRLRKAMQIVRVLKMGIDEKTDQIDAYLDDLLKSMGSGERSKMRRRKALR